MGYTDAYTLFVAAKNGDVDKIQKCIDKGIDLNTKGIGGVSPLSEASFWGNFEVVKLLVENKCEVNVVGHKGSTPFLEACIKNYTNIAIYLLVNGADPYLGSIDGIGFNDFVSEDIINSEIADKVKLLK